MEKKRRLSIMLGLITLLGTFIGVTIHANSGIKEVDATPGKVTIYLNAKNQVSRYDGGGELYWDQDGATVKVYYQEGGNVGTQTMTKTINGLYSAEIPSTTESIDFYRCDPSTGKVWNSAVLETHISYISVSSDYQKDNIFILQKYDCFAGNTAGYWKGIANFPEEDGYYILGNDTFVSSIGKRGTEWTYETSEKMETLSGEGDKARIYNLYLASGSSLKVKSCVNYDERWHDPYISEGTTGLSLSEGNYYVNTSGRYNIFVNSSGQTWACNTNTSPAITFAQSFNTAISSACTAGNKTVSTLTSAWSSQVIAAGSIDAEALQVLKEASTIDSDTDLATFAGKYDYVYGKYGYTNNWVDFANRSPSNTSGANRMIFGYININNSESIISISIISILTIYSIGMYYFFRRMKKKED